MTIIDKNGGKVNQYTHEVNDEDMRRAEKELRKKMG